MQSYCWQKSLFFWGGGHISWWRGGRIYFFLIFIHVINKESRRGKKNFFFFFWQARTIIFFLKWIKNNHCSNNNSSNCHCHPQKQKCNHHKFYQLPMLIAFQGRSLVTHETIKALFITPSYFIMQLSFTSTPFLSSSTFLSNSFLYFPPINSTFPGYCLLLSFSLIFLLVDNYFGKSGS